MGLRQRLCACCADVQHASAHDATVSLLPHWLVWCAQSISRGKAGRAGYILVCITAWIKPFYGQSHRPELEAIVASGLFEHSLSVVRAFETAGVDRLGDASASVLFFALNIVKYLRSHPGCEEKIRGLGSALAFAMEHSLDYINVLGMTTGAYATQICELSFDRTADTARSLVSLGRRCVFSQAAACLAETKAAAASSSRSTTWTVCAVCQCVSAWSVSRAASELRDVLSSFSCRITRWSNLVTGDSTTGTPTQANMVSTIDGLASPTPRGLAFA